MGFLGILRNDNKTDKNKVLSTFICTIMVYFKRTILKNILIQTTIKLNNRPFRYLCGDNLIIIIVFTFIFNLINSTEPIYVPNMFQKVNVITSKSISVNLQTF